MATLELQHSLQTEHSPPPQIPHAVLEAAPPPPEVFKSSSALNMTGSVSLNLGKQEEHFPASFSEEMRHLLSGMRDDLRRLEATVKQSLQLRPAVHPDMAHHLEQAMASRGLPTSLKRSLTNDTQGTVAREKRPLGGGPNRAGDSHATMAFVEERPESCVSSESDDAIEIRRRGGRKAMEMLGELDPTCKANAEARRRASIVQLSEADRLQVVMNKNKPQGSSGKQKVTRNQSLATLSPPYARGPSHTSMSHSLSVSSGANVHGAVDKVPEETELPPPSPATAAAAEEVQPEMHRPVQNNLTTAGESTLDRLRSLKSMKSEVEVENRLTRMKSQKTSVLSATQPTVKGVHYEMLWNSVRKAISKGALSVISTLLPPFVILLNSATLAWQTEWTSANLDEDLPSHFRWMEICFCVFFAGELLVRMVLTGLDFCCGGDCAWNLFDTVVVGLQITEAALSTTDAGGLAWVRVLRVLRLARLVRLVRWLHMVRELHTIIHSIGSSMKSLMWTVVFLSMVMYVAGLFLCTISVEWRRENIHLEETAGQELDRYWGSLPKALITLFQSITSGISWRECVNPLIDNISPVMGLVFSMYIAFAILALMNVVTGVFVESAMQSSKNDEQMTMITKLREVFKSTDMDGSGMITWEEFNAALGDPGMEAIFLALDLDLSEARSIFKLIDVEQKGEIEVEDFVTGMLRLRGGANALDMAIMIHESSRFQKKWKQHIQKVESRLRVIQHACFTHVSAQNLSPALAEDLALASVNFNRLTA